MHPALDTQIPPEVWCFWGIFFEGLQITLLSAGVLCLGHNQT